MRKATWQSLLSGAKMGVTYGAHGIWSCHRKGMTFLNAGRSFEPYDWSVALRLEGAWDVSFAKWIFESHRLFGIEPCANPVPGDPEVRMAADSAMEKIAVYSPASFDITTDVDLTGYRCTAIDLERRRAMRPEVAPGPTSTVRMPACNGDFLLLAERR